MRTNRLSILYSTPSYVWVQIRNATRNYFATMVTNCWVKTRSHSSSTFVNDFLTLWDFKNWQHIAALQIALKIACKRVVTREQFFEFWLDSVFWLACSNFSVSNGLYASDFQEFWRISTFHLVFFLRQNWHNRLFVKIKINSKTYKTIDKYLSSIVRPEEQNNGPNQSERGASTIQHDLTVRQSFENDLVWMIWACDASGIVCACGKWRYGLLRFSLLSLKTMLW